MPRLTLPPLLGLLASGELGLIGGGELGLLGSGVLGLLCSGDLGPLNGRDLSCSLLLLLLLCYGNELGIFGSLPFHGPIRLPGRRVILLASGKLPACMLASNGAGKLARYRHSS